MNLRQDKKGYWVSNDIETFHLPFEIDDIESLINKMIDYLKNQQLPFKYSEIYPLFIGRRADSNGAFWNKGYILIRVKDKSLKSKINPFHDEIHGDETIVIEFQRGSQHFSSYQEYKSEYMGYRITWKFPLAIIQEFIRILENFASSFSPSSSSSFNPSKR